MAVAEFTGADLRDWHREHATPAAHAQMVELLEEGTGMLSWESVARGLRRGIGGDIADAVDVPIVLEIALAVYVVAFGDCAQAAKRVLEAAQR